MKNPSQKLILALEIQKPTDRYNNFASIHAKFAYLEDGKVEHINYYDYQDTGKQYHNLAISNSIDDSESDSTFFSWRLEYYNLYRLNLAECEPMHKTLKEINKKYEALEDELGMPRTYGQYIAYIAKCCKIDQIAYKSEYNDADILNPAAAISYIDRIAQELRLECLQNSQAWANRA